MFNKEFSIQPVHLGNSDAAALRVMVRDLGNLQRELTRRKNQLQQIVAATFPELKTFFRNSTASPAARALLTRFPRPQDFMRAEPEEIAEVLRGVSAYRHAKRADEIRDLARDSAGVPLLTHHQWRQGWLIRQMDVLEEARSELVDQLRQSIAKHPYTPIIESLPLKSPIWKATLIAVIGDIHRFRTWNEFRAYMRWYPQAGRSGTSTDSSQLAKGGVRLGRNVLGQMAVLLQTPNVRNTPFREVYKRLLGRGMKPSTAQGHIAGKLCDVLYGMLKTMTLYDEAQHRRQLASRSRKSPSPVRVSKPRSKSSKPWTTIRTAQRKEPDPTSRWTAPGTQSGKAPHPYTHIILLPTGLDVTRSSCGSRQGSLLR
jgi:transposase